MRLASAIGLVITITVPSSTSVIHSWAYSVLNDPCISKTPDRPQFAIAFGVQDGPHAVEISEWQYQPMPPVPATAKGL